MPVVESADKAAEIAVAFLAKYYEFAQPVKATPRAGSITSGAIGRFGQQDYGKYWEVEVDVGVAGTTIAKVSVDAETGNIVAFERPASA
jgi:hypothetical protein